MAEIALITGCSSGIGRATALFLANRGYSVYATARRQDDVKKLVDDGKKIGVQIFGAQLDVTDAAACEKIVDAIVKKEGKLDILINNAGYGQYGALEELTEAQLRAQMDVNFFAPARLIKLVLPHMRERKHGTIVTVSSLVGRVAFPLSTAYCASKFAVEGMAEALRGEVSAFGIRVVLIEPGLIKTRFLQTASEKAPQEDEDEKSPYHGLSVSQRNRWRSLEDTAGSAEDVAQVIFDALTSENPKLRYPVTAMAKRTLFMRKILPEGMFERMAQGAAKK